MKASPSLLPEVSVSKTSQRPTDSVEPAQKLTAKETARKMRVLREALLPSPVPSTLPRPSTQAAEGTSLADEEVKEEDEESGASSQGEQEPSGVQIVQPYTLRCLQPTCTTSTLRSPEVVPAGRFEEAFQI